MQWQRTITLVATACAMAAVSCAPAIRFGEIIGSYRSARCVQPIIAEGVLPPTRGWNAEVTSASGTRVIVSGTHMAGGRITVRYLPNGPELVAADAGDYVYPTDVRVNQSGTALLVKAAGSAGGLSDETWLFEWSLDDRRLVSKARVEPSVLPPECQLQKTDGL